MDETGICGRDKEIKQIYEFISTKLTSSGPGILYLAGPPGTGKSMSVRFVLGRFDNIPRINLNCLRAQSSKAILTKLCCAFGLDKFIKLSESEMIARLTKKFTGRTCQTHLIVLDEMDQLPKSKNVDLIRTIFSWPNLANSKLILVGIANTVNLTSRYQTISSIIGRDTNHITKILFKPYTSKDIRSILQWYLDNDENFEDALVEPKALDMIAAKFARESGDIRGALNALRSTTEDTIHLKFKEPSEPTAYPTPPSTPPSSPCLERSNLMSVANSVRKRQRTTHYKDDKFPFPHQVILVCIYKLCSKTQDLSIDCKICRELVDKALAKYGLASSVDDYRAMLDNLELQGLIAFKKGRSKKIYLKASENELTDLVVRKEMILEMISNIS